MVEIFFLVLLLSLIILVFLLSRLWTLRRTAGALELFLCSLSCGIWSFGYALEILDPSLSHKIFWAKFEYLGISTVSVWVLLFILRYSGRAAWFNVRHTAALLIIPALTTLFAFTNELHGWMWPSIELQPGWLMAPLALGHGWWFWVIIGYSYLLLLGGTVLIFEYIFRIQRHYLSQPLVMLLVMLIPWIGNALYIMGLRPSPNLDLTPIAFTFTNIGLIFGFMRFKLLDVLPVAYSSIFKFMADGVVVLDMSNRIIDINPTARKIFQRPGFLSPTQPRDQQTVEKDPFIMQTMDQLLPDWENVSTESDSITGKEIRYSPGAGYEERIYSLRTTPIQNQRGHMTSRVLIFTDITKLKRAEERVRLQATALESAENGIVITNPQGHIEWANPSFTRLTGYSLQEVMGENPRFLKSWQLPDEYYKNLWETITTGKVWKGEMINRRKDGSVYYEDMTITPLIEANGNIAHFIAIKQDSTERKQAEEKLKAAHQQALESNRLKTQLLANVSHDMRTPLGAIIGFAEMLDAGVYGKLNTQQNIAVTDIQDSANQLLLFVNNLIGQAQFETGKILLRPKAFPIKDLIEACQSSVNLQSAKKGLQMRYELDPDLPESLFGDLYWIRQIALNLITNAVKFTDHGSVTLRLYPVDQGQWAISVTDTGIGISAEKQAAIFEPFHQVDGSVTRERGGSGLGLAIVKELTSLMNGEISLVSQLETGSTFTVRFPFMEKEKV